MQSRMQQIGRYEIERELGRGAMGIVYLARDTRLGRAVALKTIRLSDFADDQKLKRLRERLIREAQSAGSLSHENIVTIYDVEERDDISYISMEFVEGESLERALEQRRELSREKLLSLLRQMAGGLDFAHSRGIVHRDIKPANVMVNHLGRVKITDFGVAKITYATSMTQGGTMLGTPDYMSPEQIDGGAVDGRADQFSLAVIAFELLTGEKPFAADSLAALFYRIAHESAPDATLLNPSLSAEIGEVLAKAMAKKAEARFSTCMGFVDALTDACRRSPGWHALPRGMSQTLPTAHDTPPVAEAVRETIPAAAPPVMPPVAPAPRELPPLGGGTPAAEAGFITGTATAETVGSGLGTESRDWLARLEEEERASRSRKRRGLVLAIFAFLMLGGALAAAYYWLGGSVVNAPVTPPTDEVAGRPSATGNGTSPGGTESPEENAASSAGTTESTDGDPREPGGETGDTSAAAADSGAADPGPETSQASSPAPAEPAPVAAPAKPVERPVSPPRERLTTVRFMSEPPGATVTVDATPRLSCETPCSLELSVGRHTYSARRSGYRNEIRLVEVGSYGSTVNVRMQPVVGMVRVNSTPIGASVSLNGERQSGTTPMTLRLTPGRYRIVVERNGRSVERNITVQEDALIQLSADLPE